VYVLADEKWFFVGLVTRKALETLLRSKIPQADISKFLQTTQASLNGFTIHQEDKTP
jgi:hypothetical protein